MIVFDSVEMIYGNKAALDGVSFRVDPGEFVFIVGPSGAGKSTIGKLLLYETKATKGTIEVGDYNYTTLKKRDIPYLRRQIGMVFQDNKLLPDRTVFENIALTLQILGKPEKTTTKTIEELLKATGLEGMESRFPRQLSGGELQRVVIARALALDPAVLFADEPTGNLDTATALKILDLLEAINKQGTTVLMATHDIGLIKQLKKRVITLNQGKVSDDTAPKKKPVEKDAPIEADETKEEADTSKETDGKQKPEKPKEEEI
jgi:cell division transport system ATP-binding protein